MNEAVQRLETPEECEQFIKNVQKKYPDLALEAHRKAVELRAEKHGVKTTVEHELLRAVYAYEEALSAKKGRKTRASRTWQMIDRHGIINAADKIVKRKNATLGYKTLIEMNMQDFAFESVVLRYPDSFEPATVDRAKARLDELKHA